MFGPISYLLNPNIFLLQRYTGELPYPQVSLSAYSQLSLNLGTHGMNAPNTCFIPLVAGPLLNDLPSILRKVDSLGQETQKIPYDQFHNSLRLTPVLGSLRLTRVCQLHKADDQSYWKAKVFQNSSIAFSL